MLRTGLVLSSLFVLCSCCTARSTGPVTETTETTSPADERTPPADQRTPPADRQGGDSASSPSLKLEAVVNEEWEDRALALMDSATETLRVVHFECNDDSTVDKVIEGLKSAVGRGVDVQVLLEADVDDNPPRVEELEAAGIRARLDTGERYTHAKLLVADRHRVLFGSTNLSYKSIRYNNETNLYLESPAAGLYFHQYADALWAAPEKTPDLVPVGEPDIGLKRVLHYGDYVAVVTPMLDLAKERIDLLVYGYHLNPDYPDSDVHKLTALLVAAHKRGVEVRVILEISDYNEMLNEMNEAVANHLAAACIEVRFDPIDVISHAKLLLVDDTAVVGSNNWGHGGFHLYHEVGGVTDAKAAVDKLSAYFDGIWSESSQAAPRCR